MIVLSVDLPSLNLYPIISLWIHFVIYLNQWFPKYYWRKQMTLNKLIRQKIMEKYNQLVLVDEGGILSNDQLNHYYELFNEKFGPEKLRSLSGENLLNTMYDLSNKDSLVYWLEFKNDEEFPTLLFGGIGGGSALKFKIYRQAETHNWKTGTPLKQVTLQLEEAIKVTENYRDQLIRASNLVKELPENASNEAYKELESDITKVAPDIGDTAWVHKYLCLIHPSKIDTFHNPNYQRFYLLTLLQTPVTEKGRYSVTGQYIEISKELEIQPYILGRIVGELIRKPFRYWIIKDASFNESYSGHYWNNMKNEGFVGISWKLLGDLSDFPPNKESRSKIKELINSNYPKKGILAQEIYNFACVISKGDIILANGGNRQILGVGVVEDGYYYENDPEVVHRLKVNWKIDELWKIPIDEMENGNITEIKNYQNILEIQSKLINYPLGESLEPQTRTSIDSFTGIFAQIKNILDRKKQVILYGPPGTGKTYYAYEAALKIISMELFKKDFSELSEDQKKEIIGSAESKGFVRFSTFHPSYGYEDFIEGYIPQSENGTLLFQLKSGIFKNICLDAKNEFDKKYILIIDEINRGDIPRIFGELLTIIEVDKRGREIILPISGEIFSVPENVFIIGTMNTADRSIALLDTALRRRFGFIELMPDSKLLGNTIIEGIPLKKWFEELNKRILHSIGKDARNLQIGHAYFLEKGKPISTLNKFIRVFHEDIIPLLEEYCYEDFKALENILGKGIVDLERQQIRHDLFTGDRNDELIQALLVTSPEITTSPLATQQEDIDLDKEQNSNENIDN